MCTMQSKKRYASQRKNGHRKPRSRRNSGAFFEEERMWDDKEIPSGLLDIARSNLYVTKRGVSRLRGYSKTIGSMGNCIPGFDPVPRVAIINVDTEPLRNSEFRIVFLLGGPGAGKKTLCIKLAEKYDFLHLTASELIRQEISLRTERAFTLARMMSQGQLVPSDILIELLATKILENLYKKKGVIISGFPRRKEQGVIFDRTVKRPDIVLYLNVRNSVLRDRIMGRAVTTRERAVTSYDSIQKQIKEFNKRNRPILKYYNDRLRYVDGESDLINVVEDTCKAIDSFLLGTSSNV